MIPSTIRILLLFPRYCIGRAAFVEPRIPPLRRAKREQLHFFLYLLTYSTVEHIQPHWPSRFRFSKLISVYSQCFAFLATNPVLLSTELKQLARPPPIQQTAININYALLFSFIWNVIFQFVGNVFFSKWRSLFLLSFSSPLLCSSSWRCTREEIIACKFTILLLLLMNAPLRLLLAHLSDDCA